MRTILSLLLLAAAPAVLAADAEHSFQSVVPRGSVQRIVIDVPHGHFTLRTGAAETIALSGIASRDYDSERERQWAQKVVDDTEVEVYVSGAEAVVRRKFGRNASSYRARRFTGIDLRLDLPPGIDVRFETSAGEIDIAGDFGHIDVALDAGEIDLRLPRDRVRQLDASCRIGEVTTHTGTQVVKKEGLFPGKTHFFNAAGRSKVKAHVTVGEIRVVLE